MDLVGDDGAACGELGELHQLVARENRAARVLRIAEVQHARLAGYCGTKRVEIPDPPAALEDERHFGVGSWRELYRALEVVIDRRRDERVLIGLQQAPRAEVKSGHDTGQEDDPRGIDSPAMGLRKIVDDRGA